MKRMTLAILVTAAAWQGGPAQADEKLPAAPSEVINVKPAKDERPDCAGEWLKYPALLAWSWIPSTNLRAGAHKADYRAAILDFTANPSPGDRIAGYNAVAQEREFRALSALQFEMCVVDGRFARANWKYWGHPGWTPFDPTRAADNLPLELLVVSPAAWASLQVALRLAPKEYDIGEGHADHGFNEKWQPLNPKLATRQSWTAEGGGHKFRLELMNATRINKLGRMGQKVLSMILPKGKTALNVPYMWQKVIVETRDTPKKKGDKGPDQYELEVTLRGSAFPEHKVFEDGQGRMAISIDDKSTARRLTDFMNSPEAQLAKEAMFEDGKPYYNFFISGPRKATSHDISVSGQGLHEQSPFDLRDDMPGIRAGSAEAPKKPAAKSREL